MFIIGLGACFSGLGGGSTRPLRSDSLAGAFRDGLCALCMVAEASHQEQVCLQVFCKYGILRKGVQVIGSLLKCKPPEGSGWRAPARWHRNPSTWAQHGQVRATRRDDFLPEHFLGVKHSM